MSSGTNGTGSVISTSSSSGVELFLKESFSKSSNKPHFIECYAPPGPLGIIVDTTPKGPLVHSMKRTSPLKGQLQPGDIIVAIDDVDTRSMTAATLTKLMAKKSQQNQRKIKLLTTSD